MYKCPNNIALLLWPSMRSIAYLQVLNESNIFPNEIIVLQNNYNITTDFIKEAGKYNYNNFFYFNDNIELLLKNNNCKIIYHNSSNINDPDLIESVNKLNNKYIIFTGGGILRKDILSLDKIFIHIHPGIIPEYRGSTCFYYSLLENYSLGASAYFMNEDIDSGEIILQRNFTINYFINSDQHFFIDYIIDNFIRAQLLKEVLNIFCEETHFNTVQKDCSGFANYIMHPLLRYFTVNKINSKYNPSKKSGIFLKN